VLKGPGGAEKGGAIDAAAGAQAILQAML